MGLGEAEAREADDHVVDALRRRGVDAVRARRALHEALVVGLDRRRRALAAHRPPQPLRLAGREAGEGHRDLDHLVLEDDRPERVAQHRLERGMLVGHLEVRVHAQPLAALDVGVDRAALDRARAHDRDLDREVVERLRARAPQRLHLGAALDLEDPHRLGLLDGRVGLLVVEGDAREVDPLAAHARDVLHAALDRREHPEAQQVDLQEARVGAGVLVPLAELAALHGGGQDGAAVHQRAGRDDHPARVLGEVAGQAVGLVAQARQPAPAPALLLAEAVGDVALHLVRRPRLGAARHALELPRREAEDLAELADRPARAEGRERRHQRRVLAPVALVHARDQDLADVAREVEVDVGQRGQLLVEEAPEEELVGDRVDVREPGEVADDRGHRGARARGPAATASARSPAPAPRRRPRARARACRGAGGRSRAARGCR